MLKLAPSPEPTNDNAGHVDGEPRVIEISGDPRRFMMMVAAGIFRGGLHVLQHYADDRVAPMKPRELDAPDDRRSDVMTADDVAAFLGVDRNTVYDYAGRGVIPHKRLGKRMIFRRATIVAWLDSASASGKR